MHAAPETHWLLLVQLCRHEVAPHLNGAQATVDTEGQLPWLLQVAARVARPVVALQLAARQVVPVGMVQVALPVQVPWQGEVPAQGGWPDLGVPVMILQVPSLPGLLQYSHDPEQALLQQTASAQVVLRHSVPVEHDCPAFFLHAPLALQVFAPLQLSGSSAFVTATQVPSTPVQAGHVPHEAALQQRPSTQAPSVHWAAFEQMVPRPNFCEQVPEAQ
jgi:hypothetical protein